MFEIENHGTLCLTLSEVFSEKQHWAAPSETAARQKLREYLDVPLHYARIGTQDAYHIYCLQKYVEQVPTYDEATETWR